MIEKKQSRLRRSRRTRAKIAELKAVRLTVSRSNTHIYAQVIDATGGKVLASAIANASNNHDMDARNLVVAEAYVDEGPTMKRFRPRAQGRAGAILKRTSHITVIVESVGK